MAMYATPADLASFLQKDLDTATATLVLTLASAEFSRAAGVAFTSTTETYETTGTTATSLSLPFRRVTVVSAVRINGVATAADWTLVGGTLYRALGFGSALVFPPDHLEVDLTHGYAAPSDDVRKAVLESAAQAYENPVGVVQETIGGNSTRFQLSPYAANLARDYRGPVFA